LRPSTKKKTKNQRRLDRRSASGVMVPKRRKLHPAVKLGKIHRKKSKTMCLALGKKERAREPVGHLKNAGNLLKEK